MPRLYIKGIGMLIGLIVGAGMFAIPYAFAQAGIFWGLLHLIVTFLIVLLLHQWYGEVSFYTKGRHRFTGYVEIFLGRKAKALALLTTLGAFYGSLLVYGILGGKFLANFYAVFNGFSPFFFSLAIFALGGFLTMFKLNKIAEINFYLTMPIFGFIIYFFVVSLPHIQLSNFHFSGNLFANSDWFLPYGIWLFALTGFSALPETRDIFFGKPVKHFKRVIWISLAFSAVFYVVFAYSIIRVSGRATTQDALSGAALVLGSKALIVGSIIGFLAVFTSYVALAIDLKNIFIFDYKRSKSFAWLIGALPPPILYLLGINGLAATLGLIGTFGMGTLGIFIILMRRKMAKTLKEGQANYLEPIDGNKIKINAFLEVAVLIGVCSAVGYDLWRILHKNKSAPFVCHKWGQG